jgi:lipopolysaccharide export system protein LptA
MAAYAGNAQLYQGETFIKGSTILIDENTGDLAANGSVTTVISLEQETKDKRKERVRSVASAADLKYEEAVRRATYTGDAHVIGQQGDMTATKIELYLKPSGDELERVEAYENVTLRDQNRKTTGARMTYFSADERYVVTGAPVTIVDQCGRDTTGKTLTFYKATDRIVVDGNEQFRTQTKGAGTCP